MAKGKSFAAKTAKGSTGGLRTKVCPKCGQNYSPVKFVASENVAGTSVWKFNQRLVMVCQCNNAEVYG